MTASADSPRKRVPLCRSAFGIRDPEIAHPLPCHKSSGPFCSKSKRGGGRKPGQPVALSAFLEVPIRRSSFENHRPPLALPQSSGRVRNSHVSLNPLSVTLLFPAIQKKPAIVQKLWTMRLPCGSPRKSKTQFRTPIVWPSIFNDLHTIID